MKKSLLLLLAVWIGIGCGACAFSSAPAAEERTESTEPKEPMQQEEEPKQSREDISKQAEESAPSAPQDLPIEEKTPENVQQAEPAEDLAEPAGEAAVDYDLTAFSNPMVFSAIYDMILQPENYRGKTIQMQGQFFFYEDPQTGTPHYACMVTDAAACCVQGFEFAPAEDTADPRDDFEAEETMILCGVFDTYEKNGINFCWITNATWTNPLP